MWRFFMGTKSFAYLVRIFKGDAINFVATKFFLLYYIL